MMMNLFSIFDPSISLMKLNWLMLLLPLLFLTLKYMKTNKMNFIVKSLFLSIIKEMQPIIEKKNYSSNKYSTLIFLLIASFNFLSLMPYNFTITSQITFNFPMALSVWLSFLILGWLKTPKHMMSHLLPIGTPLFLMPIMITIELISQIIRPITLSVRLTANMVAGHLLLSLLNTLASNSKILFSSFLPISMILSFLEICVSIIQAYVFIILVMLYSIEIN